MVIYCISALKRARLSPPELLTLLTYESYFVIEILEKKSWGKDREVIRSRTTKESWVQAGTPRQHRCRKADLPIKKTIAFELSTQYISVLYHNKRWYKMCWQTLIKPWCWNPCWQLNHYLVFILDLSLHHLCFAFTFLQLWASPPFFSCYRELWMDGFSQQQT